MASLSRTPSSSSKKVLTFYYDIDDKAGSPQGKAGSATDVMAPAKKMMVARDLQREAERAGVPLHMNPLHPQRTLEALRLLTAVSEEDRPSLTHELYRLYWVEGKDVTDSALLFSLAQRHGLSPEDMSREEIKQRLLDASSEVAEKGGFGVPTFETGGQIVYGQDRFHFVRNMIRPETLHTTGDRLTRNSPSSRKSFPSKRLIFYHDFSSPWSYVASTQVRRVAKEHNAELVYRPILLGALFKQIGTGNVPMMNMSPHQRVYFASDLERWKGFWGIELNFPSNFPLRTVTPLRVSIVEPKTVHVIYEAAFVQDKNIGDEDVLIEVLNQAGFRGQDLIVRAQEQHIKDQLKENTALAVSQGACGVPTFQVDDSELVWGQDRFHVIEDMLEGWRSTVGLPGTNNENLDKGGDRSRL